MNKPITLGRVATNGRNAQHPLLWDGLWLSLGNLNAPLTDLARNKKGLTYAGIYGTGPKGGKSINVNGANKVVIPASYNPGIGGDFSMSFWTLQGAYQRTLVGFYQNGGGWPGMGLRTSVTGQKWDIWNGTSWTVLSNPSLKTNVARDLWSHTVLSLSGTELRGLVDGAFWSETITAPNSYTGELALGDAVSGGATWLDEFANAHFWNRAVTDAEMDLLWQDSLAPFRRKKTRVFFTSQPEATYPVRQQTTKTVTLSNRARNGRQSVNSNLWDKLSDAWMMSLGKTGESVPNLVNGKPAAVLTNMDPTADWVPGKIRQALHFQFDEYLEVTEDYDTPFPMSFSTLVKRDSSGANMCLIQVHDGSGASSEALRFYIDSSGMLSISSRHSGISSTVIADTTALTVGQWYQAVAVWESPTVFKIYKDGKEVASGDPSATAPTGLDRAFIGSLRHLVWPLNGDIETAMLHKRALSPAEVKQLHIDPVAPFRRKEWVATKTIDSGGPSTGALTEGVALGETLIGNIAATLNEGAALGESWFGNLSGAASEGILLGDTSITNIITNLAEGINLGDTLSAKLAASPTEGVLSGDQLSAAIKILNSYTQGLHAGDAWATKIHTSIQEGIALGDSWAGAVVSATTGAVTEGVLLGDVLLTKQLITLLEGINLGDTPLASPSVAPGDGANVGDSYLASLGVIYGEGASLGDGWTAAIVSATTGAVSEGVALGETYTNTLSILFTEGVTLGDTFSPNINTNLSEGNVLGDAWTGTVISVNQGTSIDGVALGDTWSATADQSPSIAEGVVLGDNYQAKVKSTYAEGVVTGDTYNVQVATSYLDGVNLGDAAKGTLNVPLTDGVVLGETWTERTIRPATLVEGALLGDTWLSNILTSLTEGVLLGDVASFSGLFGFIVATISIIATVDANCALDPAVDAKIGVLR